MNKLLLINLKNIIVNCTTVIGLSFIYIISNEFKNSKLVKILNKTDKEI